MEQSKFTETLRRANEINEQFNTAQQRLVHIIAMGEELLSKPMPRCAREFITTAIEEIRQRLQDIKNATVADLEKLRM